MIFIRYWLPVLLCMALIFCASSLPGKDIPSLFPFEDVIFHLFAYSILGYFFIRALRNTYAQLRPLRAIFLTLVFVTCYGLTDEFHQLFVAYRHASGFDVFVDSLGSLAGGVVFELTYGRNKAL